MSCHTRCRFPLVFCDAWFSTFLRRAFSLRRAGSTASQGGDSHRSVARTNTTLTRCYGETKRKRAAWRLGRRDDCTAWNLGWRDHGWHRGTHPRWNADASQHLRSGASWNDMHRRMRRVAAATGHVAGAGTTDPHGARQNGRTDCECGAFHAVVLSEPVRQLA